MKKSRSDRPAHRNRENAAKDHPPPVHHETAEGIQPALYSLATISVLVASVSSGMLVLEHLGGISLPGCGKGSPCALAAASVWGKVPYINWPVSFLGFAYFLGALITWLGSRRGVSAAFTWLVRLGALASLGFLVVIALGKYHCWYCLIAHAGNLLFWACTEWSRRTPTPTLRPIATTVAVFLGASLSLGVVDVRAMRAADRHQETLLAESTKEIIGASPQNAAPSGSQPVTPTGASAEQPSALSTQPSSPTTQPAQDLYPQGFTGRYRLGPEQAPVRVVMLTDYQCTDCNRIEKDVRQMMSERTDVSLSIKHFPMCADCNEHFKEQNMHPNACWAARAAEAAAILRGNDGFWQMHHWLFDHQGSFTDEELKQGLRELGYDPDAFIKVMMGPETLKRVRADIEEGIALGLHFTPMVFINGVELKGVFAPRAIPRTVAAVAAKNPPPATFVVDHPPPGIEKCVGDWREAPVQALPPDAHAWPKGPEDARIKIVMWSDYQEPQTAKADALIRKWMAGRSDVQYSFRHYPFNQECNPMVPRSGMPLGCKASQAAEAAGKLGGVEGYWKMHEWLMTHQAEVSDDALRRAASEMGFNEAAFFDAMASPEVRESIAEDAKAGNQMLYRGGLPTIYVNGKVVARWRLGETPVLERILNEAAGARP